MHRTRAKATTMSREQAHAHLRYMREVQVLKVAAKNEDAPIHWFDPRGNLVVDHGPEAFRNFLVNRRPAEREFDVWVDLMLRENLIPSQLRQGDVVYLPMRLPHMIVADSPREMLDHLKARDDYGIRRPDLPLRARDEVRGLMRLIEQAHESDLRVAISTLNSDRAGADLSDLLLRLPRPPSRFHDEFRAEFESMERYGIEGPIFARHLEVIRRREWTPLRENDVMTFLDDLVAGHFPAGVPSPVFVAKLAVAIHRANATWLEQKDLARRLDHLVEGVLPSSALEQR